MERLDTSCTSWGASGLSIPSMALRAAWSVPDHLQSLQLLAQGGSQVAPALMLNISGCLAKKTEAGTFRISRSSSQSFAEYLFMSSFPVGTGDLELGDWGPCKAGINSEQRGGTCSPGAGTPRAGSHGMGMATGRRGGGYCSLSARHQPPGGVPGFLKGQSGWDQAGAGRDRRPCLYFRRVILPWVWKMYGRAWRPAASSKADVTVYMGAKAGMMRNGEVIHFLAPLQQSRTNWVALSDSNVFFHGSGGYKSKTEVSAGLGSL